MSEPEPRIIPTKSERLPGEVAGPAPKAQEREG